MPAAITPGRPRGAPGSVSGGNLAALPEGKPAEPSDDPAAAAAAFRQQATAAQPQAQPQQQQQQQQQQAAAPKPGGENGRQRGGGGRNGGARGGGSSAAAGDSLPFKLPPKYLFTCTVGRSMASKARCVGGACHAVHAVPAAPCGWLPSHRTPLRHTVPLRTTCSPPRCPAATRWAGRWRWRSCCTRWRWPTAYPPARCLPTAAGGAGRGGWSRSLGLGGLSRGAAAAAAAQPVVDQLVPSRRPLSFLFCMRCLCALCRPLSSGHRPLSPHPLPSHVFSAATLGRQPTVTPLLPLLPALPLVSARAHRRRRLPPSPPGLAPRSSTCPASPPPPLLTTSCIS
jgi:hypothetical protein